MCPFLHESHCFGGLDVCEVRSSLPVANHQHQLPLIRPVWAYSPVPFSFCLLDFAPIADFCRFLFLFFLPFLLLFLISLTQTTAELCVAFFKHMQIWICNVVLNVYVRLVLVRYIWLLVVCFCALLSFATKSPFARSDDAAWSVFACVPNLSQDNQTHFVGLDEWDHQYTIHLRSNTHFEHIFNLTIYSN